MKRAIIICAALIVAWTPDASAKLVIRGADACGVSGCTTVADDRGHLFKLLSPTFRSQDGGAVPTSFETLARPFETYRHYRVTLATGTEGLESGFISLIFLPEPNYIRVVDTRRTGGLVNAGGWLRLGSAAAGAYTMLTAGLMAFPSEASQGSRGGGGTAFSIIGLAGGSLVVASLVGVLWLRRRMHRMLAPSDRLFDRPL